VANVEKSQVVLLAIVSAKNQ